MCGAPVKKVLYPVSIAFKGSGFYTTNYKNGSSKTTEPATNGISEDKPSSSEAEWDVGEHAMVHGHVFDVTASLELFSICDDKIALSWLPWKDDEEEE